MIELLKIGSASTFKRALKLAKRPETRREERRRESSEKDGREWLTGGGMRTSTGTGTRDGGRLWEVGSGPRSGWKRCV